MLFDRKGSQSEKYVSVITAILMTTDPPLAEGEIDGHCQVSADKGRAPSSPPPLPSTGEPRAAINLALRSIPLLLTQPYDPVELRR